MVDMLTAEGFTALEAKSAAEAYALATVHRPELILMDAKMPGEDGYAAARRLSAEPVTRNTPIVMVTADASDESAERAFAAGCAAHVVKPVDPARLVEVIDAVLAKRGSGTAAAGSAAGDAPRSPRRRRR